MDFKSLSFGKFAMVVFGCYLGLLILRAYNKLERRQIGTIFRIVNKKTVQEIQLIPFILILIKITAMHVNNLSNATLHFFKFVVWSVRKGETEVWFSVVSSNNCVHIQSNTLWIRGRRHYCWKRVSHWDKRRFSYQIHLSIQYDKWVSKIIIYPRIIKRTILVSNVCLRTYEQEDMVFNDDNRDSILKHLAFFGNVDRYNHEYVASCVTLRPSSRVPPGTKYNVML